VKLTPSQTLRELAEDYLHLAQNEEGKVDPLRKRNYAWLLALSVQLAEAEKEIREAKRKKRSRKASK
jgi:hypothetical protein